MSLTCSLYRSLYVGTYKLGYEDRHMFLCCCSTTNAIGTMLVKNSNNSYIFNFQTGMYLTIKIYGVNGH